MRNLPARSSGDESIETNISSAEGADDIIRSHIDMENDGKDKLADHPVGKVWCDHRSPLMLISSFSDLLSKLNEHCTD